MKSDQQDLRDPPVQLVPEENVARLVNQASQGPQERQGQEANRVHLVKLALQAPQVHKVNAGKLGKGVKQDLLDPLDHKVLVAILDHEEKLVYLEYLGQLETGVNQVLPVLPGHLVHKGRRYNSF